MPTAAQQLEKLDPREFIIIKGARVHNLKNISVALPRYKFIVITGLSGSGKSSLAFDTLFAEGQRRYVESLSSYARQFIGRMDKPDVDFIRGISPAIAIEQKVMTRNPRSTVGTTTEIYDYLKLLFARIGKTYSPVSNKIVKRDQVSDVVDYILTLPNKSKVFLLSKIKFRENATPQDSLKILMQKGFSRILVKDKTHNIEDLLNEISEKKGFKSAGNETLKDWYLIVDRLIIDEDINSDESKARLADSAQTCFYEGFGECIVHLTSSKEPFKIFSDKFELDGIGFEIPTVNLFSFNNPYGACRKCEGFGDIIGIDPHLVIPNQNLSIYDGAIVCWHGSKMKKWNQELVKNAYKFNFPIHTPYFKLSDSDKELLWTGNEYFKGINAFFKYVEEKSYKIQYRVMLSRYRGKTACTECQGTRLRKDANYVKVSGFSISDLIKAPIGDCLEIINNLNLDERDSKVSDRLLKEIKSRLTYLCDVGLSYLTLMRKSSSLSGGESQRINLASSLGSSLVGSMYILDEPSIGLHPRDTRRLIKVLKALQELGNTVIIVEHEEEIIRIADEIIDIGPHAGANGGELVFQGNYKELLQDTRSLTGAYLKGSMSIQLPKTRRKWKNYIQINNAIENNLKNINVKIPLNVLTAVTGVSGSGKTTLIKDVLYNELKNVVMNNKNLSALLSGDLEKISSIELIDQNPIGRSSRSNPVTFVKAYDDIRTLLSEQPLAKSRNFKPSFFSFNVPGGRCEMCQGEGSVTVEMQFIADIKLKCETCNGRRFQDEILDVRYNGKNVLDILNMTIDESLEFFEPTVKNKYHLQVKKAHAKLKPLADVGLGYMTLGQASTTMSGGEAQRIKLASFLGKKSSLKSILFLFDEPTTGLHFHDINKLLAAFNALVEEGNTVLIIEHNLEIIKCVDWIIDMGPEAGGDGGSIVYEGPPEGLVMQNNSFTGKFLKEKLLPYEKAL